jgi:hypothetical protein
MQPKDGWDKFTKLAYDDPTLPHRPVWLRSCLGPSLKRGRFSLASWWIWGLATIVTGAVAALLLILLLLNDSSKTVLPALSKSQSGQMVGELVTVARQAPAPSYSIIPQLVASASPVANVGPNQAAPSKSSSPSTSPSPSVTPVSSPSPSPSPASAWIVANNTLPRVSAQSVWFPYEADAKQAAIICLIGMICSCVVVIVALLRDVRFRSSTGSAPASGLVLAICGCFTVASFALLINYYAAYIPTLSPTALVPTAGAATSTAFSQSGKEVAVPLASQDWYFYLFVVFAAWHIIALNAFCAVCFNTGLLMVLPPAALIVPAFLTGIIVFAAVFAGAIPAAIRDGYAMAYIIGGALLNNFLRPLPASASSAMSSSPGHLGGGAPLSDSRRPSNVPRSSRRASSYHPSSSPLREGSKILHDVDLDLEHGKRV